jgi:hypothetical protein
MLDAGRLRRASKVAGLDRLRLRRERLPEVRHAEGAVRALERGTGAPFLVDVGLDDLGGGRSKRLCLLLGRIAGDRTGGELAVGVGEDRANDTPPWAPVAPMTAITFVSLISVLPVWSGWVMPHRRR